MKSFDDIRSYIKRGWREPDLLAACEAIVSHIEEAPRHQLVLLTYANLRDIANRPDVDEVLLSAIGILTNSAAPLLEAHLLFEADDGTEYDLKADEVKEFLETGTLVHPQSGEVVEDAGADVIPYFSPTQVVNDLKGRPVD